MKQLFLVFLLPFALFSQTSFKLPDRDPVVDWNSYESKAILAHVRYYYDQMKMRIKDIEAKHEQLCMFKSAMNFTQMRQTVSIFEYKQNIKETYCTPKQTTILTLEDDPYLVEGGRNLNYAKKMILTFNGTKLTDMKIQSKWKNIDNQYDFEYRTVNVNIDKIEDGELLLEMFNYSEKSRIRELSPTNKLHAVRNLAHSLFQGLFIIDSFVKLESERKELKNNIQHSY